jgi:hypothetical protein
MPFARRPCGWRARYWSVNGTSRCPVTGGVLVSRRITRTPARRPWLRGGLTVPAVTRTGRWSGRLAAVAVLADMAGAASARGLLLNMTCPRTGPRHT